MEKDVARFVHVRDDMIAEGIMTGIADLTEKFSPVDLNAILRIFELAARHGGNRDEAYQGEDLRNWIDFLERGRAHAAFLRREVPSYANLPETPGDYFVPLFDESLPPSQVEKDSGELNCNSVSGRSNIFKPTKEMKAYSGRLNRFQKQKKNLTRPREPDKGRCNVMQFAHDDHGMIPIYEMLKIVQNDGFADMTIEDAISMLVNSRLIRKMFIDCQESMPLRR